MIQQDLMQINNRKNEVREVLEATRKRMTPHGDMRGDDEDDAGGRTEEEEMPLYDPPASPEGGSTAAATEMPLYDPPKTSTGGQGGARG